MDGAAPRAGCAARLHRPCGLGAGRLLRPAISWRAGRCCTMKKKREL